MLDVEVEFQQVIDGAVAPMPRGSKDMMSCFAGQLCSSKEEGKVNQVILSNDVLIIRSKMLNEPNS
jgi:hypothetical protein